MFLHRRGAVLSDSSSFCAINGLNQIALDEIGGIE